MLGNELTSKFVKAHAVSGTVPTTTVHAVRWMHKLLYEFWGFCVNGSNSLTLPGGFAEVSGVLMPAGWQSGSATLLASGSDGLTFSGQSMFQAPSVNWTSGSMVGKHLVTWKSSSSSTEDSVYLIRQVINSSTIRVDVTAGGTPSSRDLSPTFSDRSNILFRVIDFNAATFLSGYSASADGLVLKLPGSLLVNSGQLVPQFRTRILTTGSSTPNVGLTMSPSGTWTPASSSGFFTDGSSELVATVGTSGWTSNASAAGTGHITLIGAQDFLICHVKGGWQSAADMSSGFHVEVPQRLQPQAWDPNPIVGMTWGTTGLSISSSIDGYGGGFRGIDHRDGSTVVLRSMVRSLTGDYFNGNQYPSNAPNNFSAGRYNGVYFNALSSKFMMSDMVLGMPSATVNSFSACRYRLRRARWMPRAIAPRFQRLGEHGEWIKVQSGILWPWDDSVLPFNLFASGL